MKFNFCHITFIDSTENIDFCVFLLFSQIIIFWKAFFLSALAILLLLSMLWIQFSNPSKPDIWVYHTKRCDFAQFCQMTIVVNIWQCLFDLEKDIQNVMKKSEALYFDIRVFQKMKKTLKFRISGWILLIWLEKLRGLNSFRKYCGKVTRHGENEVWANE